MADNTAAARTEITRIECGDRMSMAHGVEGRYPKAKLGDFDGDPQKLTEMDALIAYLQMLGTLVDFSTYDNTTGYR